MKKFFKIIGLTGGALLTSVLILLLLLLFVPQAVVNTKTFHRAQSYFKMPIHYDRGLVEVQNISLLKKHILLNFKNLCYQSDDAAISTCADEVRLGFTLVISREGLKISEAMPIDIQGGFFKSDFSKKTESPSKSNFNFRKLFPDRLRDFSVGDIYFVMKNIEVRLPNTKDLIRGDIRLSKVKSIADGGFILSSDDFKTHFEISNRTQSDLLRFNGVVQKKGDLESKLVGSYDFSSKHGETKVTLALSKGPLIEGQLNIFLGADTIVYTIDGTAELKDKTKVSGQVKGTYGDDQVAGSFTGGLFRGEDRILFGAEDPCRYKMDFKKDSDIQCGLKYFIPEKARLVEIVPKSLGLQIKAHLDGPFPKSKDAAVTGNINLLVTPVSNPVFDMKGEVTAFFEKYKISNPWERVKLNENLNFSVNRFKELVLALRKTKYQIPAPFQTLDGSIKFTSQSQINSSVEEIPLVLISDLAGPNQFFKLQSHLSLGQKLSKEKHLPFLRGEIVLDKVQLSLPRFALSKPPPLIPDSRIKKSLDLKPMAPEDKTFLYSLVIRTGTDPLRFRSNLAQGPIPMGISFNVSSDLPLTGSVDVQTFPIELFRHKAEIKYLKANFKSSRADENPVSGEVTVPFTDFKVQILISGTEKHTAIKFQSEPPYTENQILAAVLFGKSPDSLDADEASSVGNTQAAIADKALSLSSFYFLASTPVESVGYDSQAGMVTAKVKIRDGVSLDVGADTSQLREVGVNKRLGNAWYLHTYVTKPSDPTQNQSVTAFLEKLFRY
jgi:hypothetical protein